MLNEIKIGSKLFFNYGAMFPTMELTVTEINGKTVKAWDDEFGAFDVPVENIKEFGTTSVNGSPIGVFLLPSVIH